MTARLIALQMLVVAVLLGGALVVLYRTISGHLEADSRAQLDDQRVILSRWITDASARGEFRDPERAGINPLLASLADLQVRVLDGRGRVLVDTAAQAHVKLPDFPAPGADAIDAHNPARTWFLLQSSALETGSSEGPAVLQLAANMADDETLLRHLRQRMILVFAIVLIASGVLAALVARGVFRPVARLSRAVAGVQPSGLDTRVGEGWPAELTDLARELDRMLMRLDDSFHRLARFSADLSHELRTPINNLRGEAEVALSRTRSEEEYRRVLESNLEECSRIARLIDLLLFVARADHSANNLVLRPVDAVELCRDVAEFFEPLASERGVKLLVRGAGQVAGDAELLRRAITNLVDNALKHTAAHGAVDLTVRTAPDGCTEIEVRDNGRGILETELPRVFERFYRGKAGTENRERGFGLGLSIVRSIAELHRGTASIASVPQAGTTVTLRFPRSS